MNSYIMGAKRYQVLAAVVVAQRLHGGDAYVYRDGILPADTSRVQIESLLDAEMICEIGEVHA